MSRDVDRRSVLKAASVAGVAGIAGCSGGDGGSGGGGDGGGGDGGSDGGGGGDGGDGGDAEYSMTVAAAYSEQALADYMPMMIKEYKKNVEAETDGKVTVDPALGGELGAGTKLAQKVQQGTIEAAQFSMSNFAPFAPAIDLVNLPYFAGKNQQFLNLVTSDVWNEQIIPKINNNGYKIGYYAMIDPRCLATGPKVKEAPLTPEQMSGMKHRVPGSKMLQRAWQLAGANPTPIDWGETAQAMQEGVADTLHTAFQAHPAFGFTETVQDEIFIKAVEDAQVIALNREWYQGLPSDLQESMDAAGQKTFENHLDVLPDYRKRAYDKLRENDVEFHALSEDKRQLWKDAMGYQRSEWDDLKKELAGDMKTFEKFEQAARTKSDLTVSEQTIPE